MKSNEVVFESIIVIVTKVQNHIDKYINHSESGINKCENILKELTIEERQQALEIDLWLIQLNKDIIIQRVENNLSIDENIIKNATSSFETFAEFYKCFNEN